MSNEKYRHYITEMIGVIEDNRMLKQIYWLTHRLFIRRKINECED